MSNAKKVSRCGALGLRGVVFFSFALLLFGMCIGLLAASTMLKVDGCNIARYQSASLYNDNAQWQRWWATYSKMRACETGLYFKADSLNRLITDPEDWMTARAASGARIPTNQYENQCGSAASSAYFGPNGLAARFNRCMDNLHRLRSCVPHVDEDGTLVDHQYIEETFNYIESNDQTRQFPYIDRENFLESCEARISYADQRDQFGWVLPVVLAVPTALYLVLLIYMVAKSRAVFYSSIASLLRRKDNPAAEQSPKVAVMPHDTPIPDPEKATGTGTRAFERAATAGDGLGSLSDAAGGDYATQEALGLEMLIMVSSRFQKKSKKRCCSMPSCLMRFVRSRWFRTAMFIRAESLELSTQFLAFAYPTQDENIWQPILLGSLIAASAFVTPVCSSSLALCSGKVVQAHRLLSLMSARNAACRYFSSCGATSYSPHGMEPSASALPFSRSLDPEGSLAFSLNRPVRLVSSATRQSRRGLSRSSAFRR